MTPTPTPNTEIFLRVAKHLLRQGCRSETNTTCMYRSGALRCAIGCLIEDDAYEPSLEHQGVDTAVVQAALEASGIVLDFEHDAIDLLRELQDLHDDRDPSAWPTVLSAIAEDFSIAVDDEYEQLRASYEVR